MSLTMAQCAIVFDCCLQVEIRAWLHPRLGECLMHFGVFEKPQSRSWTSVSCLKSFWFDVLRLVLLGGM